MFSQHGDQAAFTLLVQRHQRRVFLLSFRLLHNVEEASEATQEAFLAAWQGLPMFRGEARFHTWLYRITYNYCMHVLEGRTQEQVLQEALRSEQMLLEKQNVQQPDLIAERYELQTFVGEHLKNMPSQYRMVLILRHLQDRTYEEMADILALPIGTIKTHLFRARKLLKERVLAHSHGTFA